VVDDGFVDDRQQWLDRIVRDALAPTALAAALTTALVAITQPLLVPPELRFASTATSLVATSLLAALWLTLRRFAPPLRWARPIAACMALIGYVNTGVLFSEMPDPRHSTTLMLMVIVSGAVLLSRRWLALHLAGALCVFALQPGAHRRIRSGRTSASRSPSPW